MKLFARDIPLTPSWDLVRPSVELLKQNIWPVFYLAFIPGVITAVGSAIMGDTNRFIHGSQFVFDQRAILGIEIIVAAAVLTLLTYPGYIYMQTQAVKGHPVSVRTAFVQGIRRVIPFIILSILEGVTVVIGLILFIIPGLIAFRAFYLSQYYLIDQKLSPVDALKKSYHDSKNVSGWIWGTIGVVIVFSILGSFLNIIPVAGPILSVIPPFLYVFGVALRYQEVATGKKLALPAQASRS